MPRKKNEADYPPVTLKDLETSRKELDEAVEVLTICEGCGVDCNEMLPKCKNLYKLLDMLARIFKRHEKEGK